MNKYVLIWMTILWASMPLTGWSEENAEGDVDPTPPPAALDPFTYHRPTQDEGQFVPAFGVGVPEGIEVLAIIEVRDRPAFAVLRIPGRRDSVTAKAGDVIRVERQAQPVATRTASPATRDVQVIYLLVREVALAGVEISPVERPSEVHVFQ